MTPHAMVMTALLLGAFVSAAGAYGLLFCLSRVAGSRGLKTASHLSYVALCAVAVAIVAFTPLHFWWKVMIAASCAAYIVIPPVTLRYLKSLHRGEKTFDATRPARYFDRHQFGLFPRA
jgi:hypothetical protein